MADATFGTRIFNNIMYAYKKIKIKTMQKEAQQSKLKHAHTFSSNYIYICTCVTYKPKRASHHEKITMHIIMP